ncbi:hypothetical protein BKM20_25140 [Pseudomonas avellanae]|uniref:Uncharacterized protein n=2 Tax=Pseudomonas avellanae TaxID=46257 RepID=A0AAD0GPM6_9PSED|nr:hypothetical protein BKM03_19120 [Pseudomonas avellanae]EGH14199.1 hypothetical protein PSYMP_26983 [Pseudomonas amygdali pv. morsprunorum str. M302280]KWS56202.1 hypothetical protein AL055_07490 [Pseudomonas amygdali pv. morsprunorum]PHN49249.1 hypothetical protein AO261_19120 [Pseudomonas avellanae]POC83367.1 hypothetical protein BKM26_25285 [Pseudomonas avellanae]
MSNIKDFFEFKIFVRVNQDVSNMLAIDIDQCVRIWIACIVCFFQPNGVNIVDLLPTRIVLPFSLMVRPRNIQSFDMTISW